MPAEATVSTLSGGWRRRVLLARALVATRSAAARRADQPSRHRLDRAGSKTFWPTTPARSCSSRTIACFCSVATRIVELDRGRLTSWPGDYATFQRRKEESLANEAVHDGSSTSGWRTKKPGCGRASKRGARGTKDGCARCSRCERSVRRGACRSAQCVCRSRCASAAASCSMPSSTSASRSAAHRSSAIFPRASCVAIASASSDQTAQGKRRC